MERQLTDVSDYLLQLYARSAHADASAYSAFALEELSRLLVADKAWWGVIAVSESGPHLQSSFRSGLPPSWDTAWEAVKGDDIVATTIAHSKNQTMSLDVASMPATHRLGRLAGEFDIGEVLSIAIDLPDRKAFMFVSLYRDVGRPPFTLQHKTLQQALIPHLHAAWQMNLRERLRDDGDGMDAPAYKAFVDRDGRLVQCEESFSAAVSRRWTSWSGLRLPMILGEAIERCRIAPGRWMGLEGWTVRSAPAGLLTLVELREVTVLDLLRPRERQVARLFGEGASHKDIARLTGLTPATVRHYLREVYAKLGIDNKATLANLLHRQGRAADRVR